MDSVWLFTDPVATRRAAQKAGTPLEVWENEKSTDGKAKLRWAAIEYADIASKTEAHLRSHYAAKGKTLGDSQAQEQSGNALMQAGDLLFEGVLDVVLAGSISPTSDVIRAAISSVGLARGVRTVSGAFILDRPQEADSRTFLYADCGVVIEPTAEQLCDIAWESVRTWQLVLPHRGDPVVAFLSFSTKGSANHSAQEKMAKAAALFKERHPEILSDGELQFDAAFDPATGKAKAPGSLVPGNANIFIFPNLDSGNIAYKISQRLGGFRAYGPILQGLAKPFSDLSRGATVEDIVTSANINLLRSRQKSVRDLT